MPKPNSRIFPIRPQTLTLGAVAGDRRLLAGPACLTYIGFIVMKPAI
jgi:hypothetical protein